MKFHLVLISLLLSSTCSIQQASATGLSQEALFLKELVTVSSGTGDVAGVNQVQAMIAEKLKKMGFAVELRSNPDPHEATGQQLVGTLKGTDPRFITLIGHADTVFEKLNPFEVVADGRQAKGSGVADNKGGLVVGIAAIQAFLGKNASRFSLRFIVSPSEETGSNGFQEGLKQFARDSVMVLGLEPARENGAVVISRKGSRWYSIHVTGKEAHAGVDHQSGINACHELAIKLDKLQKLTDYKTGNTVSIGRIEGGKDKFNIVCGNADAKVDARFTEVGHGRILFAGIEKILATTFVHSFKTKEPTQTRFVLADDSPPFHFAPKTKPLLENYLKTVSEIEGRPCHGEATGGAADVNFMDREGISILDGLGPIGGGYHTSEEFVVLGSLQTRSLALARFLKHVDTLSFSN